MAPLPHNSTDIMYIDYTVCTYQHTAEIRMDLVADVPQAQELFAAILDAVDAQLYALTIDGARFQEEDTNVSYPIAWTEATSFGSDAGDPSKTAQYMSWVGRDLGGRRNRLMVFGCKSLVAGNNYRASAGEVAAFDAAVALLEAAEGVAITIGGGATHWKTYTNLGLSAYWRNKIR